MSEYEDKIIILYRGKFFDQTVIEYRIKNFQYKFNVRFSEENSAKVNFDLFKFLYERGIQEIANELLFNQRRRILIEKIK